MVDVYRYRISKTGGGSARYGPCEVCNEDSDTTYIQVEEKKYQFGWTQHNCNTLFGHKECLENLQKPIEAI